MASRNNPPSIPRDETVDWGLEGHSTTLPSLPDPSSEAGRIKGYLPDEHLSRSHREQSPKPSHSRFRLPALHLPNWLKRSPRQTPPPRARPRSTYGENRPSLDDPPWESRLPDLPDSRPTPKRTYTRDQDIWGDAAEVRALAAERRAPRPTIIERVTNHKKPIAGVMAGLSILGGATRVAQSISEEDKPEAKTSFVELEEKEATPSTKEQPNHEQSDLDKDGHTSEIEQIAYQNSQLIPSVDDLPEIQETPLRNTSVEEMDKDYQKEGDTLPDHYDQEGEVSTRVSEFEPKFIGGYESITGMKLNIYVDSLPEQEEALDQEFVINPESIEFILTMIRENIDSAPDSPTKDAIIQNLEDMRSGKDDRLFQVIFDMSDTPTCLDADYQLTKFLQETCNRVGVALVSGLDEGEESNIPILINSGIDYEQVNPEESPPDISTAEFMMMTDEEHDEYFEKYGINSEAVVSPIDQTTTLAHELNHGISGVEGLAETPVEHFNTYEEGDHEHKVVDWLIGDRQDSYDLDEANPSPNLRQQIELLTKAGLLKPIIEVKK